MPTARTAPVPHTIDLDDMLAFIEDTRERTDQQPFAPTTKLDKGTPDEWHGLRLRLE